MTERTAQEAGAKASKDAAQLLVVLALLLAAISYSNTLSFAFVYDDLTQIVNNPRVHSWEHAPRLFVEHVWTQSMLQGAGNYYRPLFELWLLIQYSLFGLHPWAWHLTTVAVHLGVVGLAYLVLKRVAGDRVTAAMATVLFAVHPTHIETVAWISGITDSLCALFALGSVLAYLRSREERNAFWLAGSVCLYVAAMMSKETAIVVPAMLLAYDWLIAGERKAVEMARRMAPFAVAGIAYLIVRHYVLAGFLHAEEYSAATVALTLPKAAWFYARQLLWPVGLSVFYDFPFVVKPGFGNVVLPLVGLVVFVAAVTWLCRQSRAATFGALWMFLFLLPALVGIYVFIPEELVHDRYLYLPSLGFAMLVAIAIRNIRGEGELLGGPKTQMAITLLLGAVLAAGTATQNQAWTNDLILYAHGVSVAPNNVVAIDHLANEMFKRNKPNEALALYDRALQVNPKQWQTHFAKGVTLFELGDYRQANEQMEEAARIAPENAEQFYFMGLSQMQMGNFGVAEEDLRRARALNPKRPGANLALAIALEKQGKIEDAKAALREEMRVYPSKETAAELMKLGERQDK